MRARRPALLPYHDSIRGQVNKVLESCGYSACRRSGRQAACRRSGRLPSIRPPAGEHAATRRRPRRAESSARGSFCGRSGGLACGRSGGRSGGLACGRAGWLQACAGPCSAWAVPTTWSCKLRAGGARRALPMATRGGGHSHTRLLVRPRLDGGSPPAGVIKYTGKTAL